MSKKSMLAISRSSIERGLPVISSSSLIADRHLLMSSRVSCIPIQPANPYLATRFAAIFGTPRPPKKIGGGGFLKGFTPTPHFGKEADSPGDSNTPPPPPPTLHPTTPPPTFFPFSSY